MLKFNFIEGNQQSLPLLKKRSLQFCSIIFPSIFIFNSLFSTILALRINCLKDELWAQGNAEQQDIRVWTHLCRLFPLMVSIHLEASSLCLFQRRHIETHLLKAIEDSLLRIGFQDEIGRLFAWSVGRNLSKQEAVKCLVLNATVPTN